MKSLEEKSAYARAYYKKNKAILLEKKKEYYSRNKERQQAYQKDYLNRDGIRELRKENRSNKRAALITHYVVYIHSNDSGDTYIGAGNNIRPYLFQGKNRTSEWRKYFEEDNVNITILRELSSKKEALEYESEIIRKIGLDNLVNLIH